MADENKKDDPKEKEPAPFGGSHLAYDAGGQLIKRGKESGEICPVCINSIAGPTYFSVERVTPQSIHLVCPNCGERKTGYHGELKLEKDEKPQQ